MQLSGNTVLITGGATGIGYALAEAFLRAGSEVVICGRREERLREARKRHPELHVRTCDVTDTHDCRAMVQWLDATFKNLNVLVNNAGVQRDIDLTQGADAILAGESEIKINLEAPIILSGLLIPHLLGRREPAIVNVSSGLGFVPMASMPIYGATKAGLHAFSLSLRHQLAKHGIKVFEVVPPAVDTELNPEGRAQRGGFKAGVTADELATAVMQGLEADSPEIGYGVATRMLQASRAELDGIFQRMNSHG